MSIVVREQDILSKECPNGGVWNEDNIRAYQEGKGINYASTVYVAGVKPYREWSNDPNYGRNNIPVAEPVDSTESILRDEIAKLKAELDESKKNTEINEIPVFAHTGVERHGLHDLGTDKRTKEYRDRNK